MPARDPATDLRRIAFLLERAHEATYRVRAFRAAAAALDRLDAEELRRRVAAGTLTEVSGVGDVTARCVAESLAGEEPVYLRRLRATAGRDLDEASAGLRAALRGDCHTHSDWSDGGSPIEEMVAAAIELGHEYMVLTDHSPRLTVARGLTAERLRRQLDVVAELNERLAGLAADGVLTRPFRLLTGIEVDILADGSLDQDEDLLATLDVVVGSVHSGLRDDAETMTARMLAGLANPHLDILGHCTGRLLPRARQPIGGSGIAAETVDDSDEPAGSRVAAPAAPAGDGGPGSSDRPGPGDGRSGGARSGAGVGARSAGGGVGSSSERSGAGAGTQSAGRGDAGSGAADSARSGGRGGQRSRERGGGRGRPESVFDAPTVFAAAVEHGKAIEINSRPERLDPPKRLLRLALETGCLFTIDTDAHAPGQLDWLPFGCARAAACGVPTERVVNTWPAEDLLAWAKAHG
jgi:putative hydrolase